jgi:hypothetical protein
LRTKDTRTTKLTLVGACAFFEADAVLGIGVDLQALQTIATVVGRKAFRACAFVAGFGLAHKELTAAAGIFTLVIGFTTTGGAFCRTSTTTKLPEDRLVTGLSRLALTVILTQAECRTTQTEALSTCRSAIIGAAARLHTNVVATTNVVAIGSP